MIRQIVGFLHDGSPIVRGPAETVKKFQSILIAEHATMSRVLPWAAAIHTANGEDLVEQLLQNVTSRRIALPFPLDVGSVGEEHRQYNTLDCVVRSFISDSSAHLRQAIERSLAKAKESGQHVTILSVGCTASVTQHILSQYTARGIEIEVVDLATQLTQGNYCGPTAGPTSLSAVKGTPATEIAIVGMSCRVPGAESNEEFWNLLEAGLDMCQRVSRPGIARQ